MPVVRMTGKGVVNWGLVASRILWPVIKNEFLALVDANAFVDLRLRINELTHSLFSSCLLDTRGSTTQISGPYAAKEPSCGRCGASFSSLPLSRLL